MPYEYPHASFLARIGTLSDVRPDRSVPMPNATTSTAMTTQCDDGGAAGSRASSATPRSIHIQNRNVQNVIATAAFVIGRPTCEMATTATRPPASTIAVRFARIPVRARAIDRTMTIAHMIQPMLPIKPNSAR